MKPGEIFAALGVAVVGVPLLVVFAIALGDGETQRREGPLRGFFSARVYERLAAGDRTATHYLGDDRTAPDFSLPDKNGRLWTLRDHRGRVVVINFWSITCEPCIEEMGTLEDLARIFAGRDDVEIVTVSTDSGWNAVESIFPDRSLLTVLFDPSKAVVEGKYGTRLYPETWIIDADGVIRLRYDGARDWADPLVAEVIESFL